MNYFAHARRFLRHVGVHRERFGEAFPYFLAGTALPDWLSVIDRRARIRRKRLPPFCETENPVTRAVAVGARQHLIDDAAFHRSEAFLLTLGEAAEQLRRNHPGQKHRSFFAHLMVEVLLDDTLIARERDLLEDYYRELERIDPERLAAEVAPMTGREVPELGRFVDLFRRGRILEDYADDAMLFFRMSQVMQRVGIGPLWKGCRDVFPNLRELVADRAEAMRAAAEAETACPLAVNAERRG
jgi:hypothetical protein